MDHTQETGTCRSNPGSGPVVAESALNLGREICKRVVGLDREVPLFGGVKRPYVNVDNAATTPPFRDVADCVSELLEWYGSVHRGTGAKSRISTRCYDRCREIVADWVGADLDRYTVVFTRSTTDSINKVARTLKRDDPQLVICTLMEHHSNLLPWRANCRVDAVDVRDADGSLDLDQFEDKLKARDGAVRLVAVSGASNVTGLTPPIYLIARMAHEHGAEILVDGAQLVGHRAVRMGGPDEPERLDYLAFSAHKMYAPFGTGVVVAPRAVFDGGVPECVGGGTVRLVTNDRVLWADAPAREEAGTPNVVGAVALAKAIRVLQEVGMDRVAAHDAELRALMVDELRRIPGIRIYGEPKPQDHGQVGVIGFVAEKMHHSLIAAALGHEWGIGVRHGCFCAHPYLIRLLGVKEAELDDYMNQAESDDYSRFPGLVRISLGIYNTPEDVAYVADALKSLLEDGPRTRYVMDSSTGEYLPVDGIPLPGDCFEL